MVSYSSSGQRGRAGGLTRFGAEWGVFAHVNINNSYTQACLNLHADYLTTSCLDHMINLFFARSVSRDRDDGQALLLLKNNASCGKCVSLNIRILCATDVEG